MRTLFKVPGFAGSKINVLYPGNNVVRELNFFRQYISEHGIRAL